MMAMVQKLSKPDQEAHGLSFYEEYSLKINMHDSFSKAMNLAFAENWVHQSRKRAYERAFINGRLSE